MAFGISTSCLYPMTTEKSLDTLGKMGVKTCEVFLNSISETTTQFAKILNDIKDYHGMKIVSVHPFSSFSETYMMFSQYERRFNDILEFYKKCFEVTNLLGARISIIHGSLLTGDLSHNEYFCRFQEIINAGKEFGITVCQENVNRHFSENPEFLKKMRSELGRDFKMVFDVKQAVRAGFSPLDFAEEFKKDIVHIHISDHDKNRDCLPPGCGNFEFKKLIEIMDSADYKGDYIIELYRNNFGQPSELTQALAYMQIL